MDVLEGRTVSAVILAAGSSARYGAADKLYECLGGRPLLCHSAGAFLGHPAVDQVVVVAREDRVELCRGLFAGEDRVTVIPGGDTRCRSALLGAQASSGDLLLIHDGARPFVGREVIDRCLVRALETGGAVAALPAVDTVKVCDNAGLVVETTPRRNTWRIQSPQTFLRERLLAAYARTDPGDPDLTDDCMAMERAGYPVSVVMGARENFKVTTPEDCRLARDTARRLGLIPPGTPGVRMGIGQDSHRFDPGDKEKLLVLGGVPFPGHVPLSANSDGDVVLHALCNAISGITCENILGARADAICRSGVKDSRTYVREALRYLDGRLTHLSFTVECKTPLLAPRIPEMRRAIGELTGLPEGCVGITATSGEGLTDFGRGLGISVFCVATAQGVF